MKETLCSSLALAGNERLEHQRGHNSSQGWSNACLNLSSAMILENKDELSSAS
jgi:hypothetical protein